MKVSFHHDFKKSYKKLLPAQKKRFAAALRIFELDPHHASLCNHALNGQWDGHRSISFGGDWRAHYIQLDDLTALFVAIGTHSQLYG